MRLFFTFVLLIAQHTFASEFSHLQSGMSFTDVQKHYPKAQFELTSTPIPDKTHQYFNIKNSPHEGQVVFIFLNGYLIDHAAISEFEQKILVTPSAQHASLRESINRLKQITSRPFKDQLLLASIVWEPSRPVMLGQAFKQYGSPDSDGIDKFTKRPFIRWKKGIDAFPTSSGAAINHFEFWFTRPLSESLRHPLSR